MKIIIIALSIVNNSIVHHIFLICQHNFLCELTFFFLSNFFAQVQIFLPIPLLTPEPWLLTLTMAHRSQSSSIGDNPLDPNYLPPHYREEYRLAIDALIENDIQVTLQFSTLVFLMRVSSEYLFKILMNLCVSPVAPGLLWVPPDCRGGWLPGTVGNWIY